MKKYLLLSLAFLCIGIVFGFVWKQQKAKQKHQTNIDGKYKKNWDKIDSLLRIGQPKTALIEVENLLKTTEKNEEHAEWLRALMFKFQTSSQYEENYINKNVQEVQQYIAVKPAPIKQVLHTFLATLYWNYYQNNTWKIQNRSITVDFKNDDIETWDFEKFLLACHENYQLSLKNPELLQKINIEEYGVILDSKESFDLRPTLYDFLAHRAIDFYRSTEIDLNNAQNQFKFDKIAFLQETEAFINTKLESKKEFSYKHEMTLILQDLLKFRIKEGDKNALVDADLKRINFVYEFATFAQKDTFYLQALEKIATNGHESSARGNYEIANYYFKKKDYVKAHQICQKTIEKYPENQGAINCKSILLKMEEKEFSINLEEYILPNSAILAKINHRNTSKVFIKIVPTTDEEIQKMDYYNNEVRNTLKNFDKSTTFTFDLPVYSDFQTHSTEIKLPKQTAGRYVVLMSATENFNKEKNYILAAKNLMVTDVSILDQRNGNEHQFFVLSRKSGFPLKNKKVEVFEEKYNRTKREYEVNKIQTIQTDENGYLKFDCKENGGAIYLKVFNTATDIYFNKNAYSLYRQHEYNASTIIRTHLFTDRKIYRPTQLVYFKGIVINYDNENYQKREIVANKNITVILKDPNYQKVSEMQVTTNEYGTYSGTFTLPEGKLNGNFMIDDGYGNHYIKVEEYKRPTFETTIKPIEGQFRLNDKINVTGNAKAFSGAVIDQAKVSYSITRSVEFPYWCYGWWNPAPKIPTTTIINATTMTDENGDFKFDFIAFPDDNTNLKDNPLFRYVISVDVTDLNGETHSTSYSVAVSNQALSLDINIPTELEKIDKKTFLISSTNLQGQAIPSKGTITIQRLKTPEKAYLNRLWGYAEKIQIPQENFEQEFSYAYENVEDQTAWKVEKELLKMPFNTEKTSEFEIKTFNKEGVYKVILESIDAYGQKIEQIKYVKIHDSNAKNLTVAENFFVKSLKTSVEPTENAEILIGSSHNVRVLYEIEHNKKIVHREWIELKNEQRKISIPIKEEHRGNFVTRFVCIYNNRIYSLSETIYVPFSNKDLNISFETFRDKLEPGAKEQWKLKIKGKNGDKVGAEFLTTLYDASLDKFAVNAWDLAIYGTYYPRFSWDYTPFGNTLVFYPITRNWNQYSSSIYNRYYQLDWHGYEIYYTAYDDYGGSWGDSDSYGSEDMEKALEEATPTRSMKKERVAKAMAAPSVAMDSAEEDNSIASVVVQKSNFISKEEKTEEKKPSEKPITPRTNFNETAFFFPHLETDSEGSIIVNFTIPESLTKWKMLGLAHTKDLKIGTIENQLVTQKELMISANAPRFFRENDQIYFTAKINNLSDKVLTGTSILELTDAISGKNIDNLLGNTQSNQSFEVKAGQSTVITWSFKISDETQAITYKVSAKAGNFTDGEQKTIPVMSNRMLVTETMPLWIRGKQQKTVEFKNFEKASSTTLKHHQFTLEFTANPTWYAVQSLPYLMEYPYECAEQTFSRLYANTISSHIIEKHPKIKEVFKKWETLSPDAFLSNLEKNEELKSVLLQETPWVLQAKDENARKRRIAVLFDLNRMANEEETAIKRLQQLQLPSGGWAWFKGMYEDRYVTQHIVTGTGKLRKLGVDNPEMVSMAKDAILYLDEQILADYQWLKKNLSASEMEKQQVGYTQIHYLYMRTFFSEVELKSKFQEAYNYYFKQSQKYWMNQSRYMKGMLAIVFERKEDTKTASLITRSLKENALFSEELGMYWKDTYGYYWYQAPIETHALMIEVFDEVAKDAKSVEELKIWLLKNKQTNDWKTTKATVEACYVLLSKGDDWLASTELPTIEVGNYEIKYKGQAQKTSKKAQEVSVEAGTGYFKTTWSGKEVDKSMGTIKIDNPNASIAWGGIYWQYFEQLDKITNAETPLSLKKQLFVERKTEDKVSIEPITEKTILKTGDRIKVRIELRVDRAMEYVHMKDMRASSFEPENVISQYKYQGGLGYYESTKDASTNFFFNYLPKGTFVFEYNLRVTHAGNFSNGITSIQCMYAPEFSSHSEGVRVEIKK